MSNLQRATRVALAAIAMSAMAACSQAGTLGSVLGSVLGAGAQEVSGVVAGVDTRAQQVSIQQSNGQTVAIAYDNATRVVYNNQNYPVTSLERGDQVTARIQSNGAQGYYTDLITVTQSVSTGNTGTPGGNVQLLQGTVRQVDQTNGWFTMDVSGYGTITVTLPYNVSSSDRSRFQQLRPGDATRIYGVFVNQTRVEFRQFY
ncbi:MAG: hypothetical protein ACYC3Q_00090 [Gemmatimonadaceae bacterium]